MAIRKQLTAGVLSLVVLFTFTGQARAGTRLADITVGQAAMCSAMFISLIASIRAKTGTSSLGFGYLTVFGAAMCFISDSEAAEMIEQMDQGKKIENKAFSRLEEEVGADRARQVLHMIAARASVDEILEFLGKTELLSEFPFES